MIQDRDLTFYVQGYRDARQAKRALASLRSVYPSARTLLVSDGDPSTVWRRLASRFRAELTMGERLYPVRNGGRMIQRMLDLHLAEPTRWLVKIDTDSRVHRAFGELPETDCLFGTPEWKTTNKVESLDFPNLQGGCVGFAGDAVRRISDSGILESESLLDPPATYADVEDIRRRAADLGLISFDFMLRWVCRELGLPMVAHPEIDTRYCGMQPPDGGGYAITHPHKLPPPIWSPRRLRDSLRRRLRRS